MYAASTDFLALLRSASGTETLERMPGLDYVVAAMARAGLASVYVGQTAPTVNQATTVWLQPASPSWTAEGKVFLWDSTAGAYALATPSLWSAFFSIQTPTQQFETRAAAAAVAISAQTLSIRVTRYATGYPLSNATYVRGISTGPAAFQDAGGTWWVLDLSTDEHNVYWFGAKGGGVTNDTAALQLCALWSPQVDLAGGSFLTTAAITLSGAGAGIISRGPSRGTITILSTTAPCVIQPNTIVQPTSYRFTLKRSPLTVPVAGAVGFDISAGSTQGSYEDIVLDGHYQNLLLGATDSGRITRVTCKNSISNGILMTPAGTDGTMQWQLDDVLVVQSGGNAIRLLGKDGCGQLTMGEWRSVQTFANSGRGLSAEGVPTCPIQAIRARNCFFGADGSDEVFLDTYNTQGNAHEFDGLYIEEAGLTVTGPGLLTPASNLGRGLNATINNNIIKLTGPTIVTCSQDGIVSLAKQLLISNPTIANNSLATVNTYNGVTITTPGRVTITGGSVSDTVAGLSQKYGVSLGAGTDNNVISDVDLRLFFTGAIQNLSTGTNNRVRNNLGYNPIGQTLVGVLASPMTYTAGPSPETLYVQAGTWTRITFQPSGLSVVPVTNGVQVLELGPNEVVQLVYTVAPTAIISSKH